MEKITTYYCYNCGKELTARVMYCSNECQQKASEQHKQQSYGHTALPRYLPKTLPRYEYTALPEKKIKLCSHCDKTHYRNSQYCSNACKQAAYRKRHDPETGIWKRKRERAQKAAWTKQSTLTTIVCEHCGDERRLSVAECTNRRYCSNACKQASYRERKKQ